MTGCDVVVKLVRARAHQVLVVAHRRISVTLLLSPFSGFKIAKVTDSIPYRCVHPIRRGKGDRRTCTELADDARPVSILWHAEVCGTKDPAADSVADAVEQLDDFVFEKTVLCRQEIRNVFYDKVLGLNLLDDLVVVAEEEVARIIDALAFPLLGKALARRPPITAVTLPS